MRWMLPCGTRTQRTSPAERHASSETLHCVMGLGPFHQQQPKANCPLMRVL